MRVGSFSVLHFKAISLKMTTSVIGADINSQISSALAFKWYIVHRQIVFADLRKTVFLGGNIFLSFYSLEHPS